ncbi:MAG: hypothetical protein KIT16_21735, partial [Rhodospirillaceae bacterium]|nr:hypothetical protein [Rhodospirillaceae bacterium]
MLPTREARPKPARRPLLTAAILASVAAHLAVAGAFWVEQAARPEPGAALEIEIVAQAGQAQAERRNAP